MLALFADDSLRWMKVWPAAEAIYFRADEEDRLEGAVRFSADSLAFRFDGDDLQRVQGVRGIEGTYYDAGLVPNPLRLDGFRYAPERRPTRARLLADDPFERGGFLCRLEPDRLGVSVDVDTIELDEVLDPFRLDRPPRRQSVRTPSITFPSPGTDTVRLQH